MCIACGCNSQFLDIFLGERFEPQDDPELHNDKLFTYTGFGVDVATKDYFDIKKGSILFINCNDPSFVFDAYPPKRSNGRYIQAHEYYTDSITNEDAELMEEYFEHIKKNLGSTWDFSDMAKLIKSAEYEGVQTTKIREIILWVYDKLVKAAEKVDTMDLDSYQIHELDENK